jgi:hypothetical protein
VSANAARIGEKSTPLRTVRDEALIELTRADGSDRLAEVDRPRRADEDTDDAQLCHKYEGRDHLLGEVHREGGREVRKHVPQEQPAVRNPQCASALDERRAREPVELRPHDAVWTGPSDHEKRADEYQHCRVGFDEHLHEQERDDRRGDRADELRERVTDEPSRRPQSASQGKDEPRRDPGDPGEDHERESGGSAG